MGESGPMAYLAGVLGLRWAEIAGLRVGRIDFLRQTVRIDVQRTMVDGHMVESEPKTQAGRRTVSAPGWLMHMLADHVASRELTGADAAAYVFVGRVSGEALHYDSWRANVWLPAREAAGFPELHFHDLRHTAASWLVAENVDVKTAQVRLGHTNPNVTLRLYAKAVEERDREAAEKVGERLRPRAPRGLNHRNRA
jgi:integrase